LILERNNGTLYRLYIVKPDGECCSIIDPDDPPLGPFGMLSDDELDISIMVYPESYPWIGDKRYKLGLTGEFVSKL